MKFWLALFITLVLFVISLIGAKLPGLFGVFIPYVAIVTFIGGFIYKIIQWSKAPVPFREPTVCGQEKSLPWIKNNNLESPHDLKGVLGRMFLEIFFFRSLFRNTQTELEKGPHLVYKTNLFLWGFGLIFHYSFLMILLRHFRFFTDPVWGFVHILQKFDGLLEISLPTFYLSNIGILLAAGYLLFRRLAFPKIRYISLMPDYFALLVILMIVASGICMRYFYKVDVVQVKTFMIGLLSLKPVVVEGAIGSIFYVHLFFVSVLLFYFPFSKLMHMPGVFLSPTRNLANNNRMKRHINPWNPEVKFHTYAEYEDEFREPMKEAGLPVDKE